MGRFASTVEFYTKYREPYPHAFFEEIAKRLGLRGHEKLLDIGCGPAPLAIGLAPFVGGCTGIDPEDNMIAAARAAAANAVVSLSLIHGRIEDFAAAEKFDIITIGRALHWMDRKVTLRVLEQIVSGSGRILICGARTAETGNAWAKNYDDARHAWASGPDIAHYRLDANEWFAGSWFKKIDTVLVTERQSVSANDLIGRALSKSNTSPAMLGDRREEFEAEIRSVLEPFARDGVLEEEIVAQASIFARE